MKFLLVTVFIVIAIVCWIFGTSTTVNGKNSRVAFRIKSVFYWVAVALAFGVGLYVA